MIGPARGHGESEGERMDLGYVKEFVALADEKSYYNVASEFYLSQSALSKHIRNLEEELGEDLFDHSRRNARLTEFGECFYKYAVELVGVQEECKRELGQLKHGITYIKLGAIMPQAEYDIFKVIGRFERETDSCRVEIVEGSSARLLEMMRRGEIDMVFVENRSYDFNVHGDFEIINFCRDTMCVLLPADHPMAGQESVEMEQLEGERFIVPAITGKFYEYFLSLCENAGFKPDIVYITYRIHEIMDLITKGWGISVVKRMPARYYSRLYPEIKIVELRPKTEIYIDFVYKKNFSYSEMERKLIECVNLEAGERRGDEEIRHPFLWSEGCDMF